VRRQAIASRSNGPFRVIDTAISTKAISVHWGAAPIDPNEVAKNGVPVGRAGQAQDIVNGLLLFTSDMSSYMTGAELVIEAA